MSKESFKLFVRKHPELIEYVNTNQMTWQKFYDMYSLYGEDPKAWSSYVKNKQGNSSTPKKEFRWNELINYMKNVDMDSLQRGISGIEKAISFIQDLGFGKNNPQPTHHYQPRPIYKSFED